MSDSTTEYFYIVTLEAVVPAYVDTTTMMSHPAVTIRHTQTQTVSVKGGTNRSEVTLPILELTKNAVIATQPKLADADFIIIFFSLELNEL